MLTILDTMGISIRPEEMQITWEEVRDTLLNLKSFVEEKGYMYTVANVATIDEEFCDKARKLLYSCL